jgi:predicted ATPase
MPSLNMLTSLASQNFKCFSNLRIRLGQLTLLTGFNGGGKSTSIQPLLLLGQAVRRDADRLGLSLNGPLVQLGTAGDVVSPKGNPIFYVASNNDEITWNLAPKIGERTLFVTSAEATRPRGPPIAWQGTALPIERTNKEKESAIPRSIRKALSSLIYISAARPGTPDVYPFPQTDDAIVGDVGSEGQYASYWYDRMVDDEIDPKRRYPDEVAVTLRKQVDACLSSLFPTAQANVTAIREASALALRFRIGESTEWRRPANIGFGLTYAFPILVSLLTTSPQQTLIIDSPEAHLHPSVQSQMGRILARTANANVQLIVETHSDHLLNGVRLAVKEGLIRHDQVAIHFFGGVTTEAHGVTSPRVDAEGNISDWPLGFFDQSERDLARLSGWT